MTTWKILAALALAAAAGPALASLAVPVSVEDLARESDVVVRGRIERVTPRWSADGKHIITYAEVVPSGVWKGTAPPRVTVAVPGGTLDGVGQLVHGAPVFTVGEEVVLFLSKIGDQEFQVRGLSQGKFAVQRSQASPNTSGLAFVRGREALRAGERRAEPMPVDELERRVRAVK